MYDDDGEEVDLERAMARQRAWVTDDELAGMALGRATGVATPDGKPETHMEQARRMLREAAPMAAASLVRLAQNAEAETVRLRASVEILTRAEQVGSGADGREPWEEVYEKALTPDVIEKMADNAKEWVEKGRP
jgi:hypothetical protein